MGTELEHILISEYKDGMIAYMDSHPEAFEEAIELAISDKQPFSWRAAWLLWSCMKENDRRIQKHITAIMNSLNDKGDGHQRELIKILSQMKLNEEHEGVLFDICVDLWKGINKTPSVRLTAFKFLIKIAKKYPELSHEIVFLAQNHYLESLSPGVNNSISKMMREFTNH